LNILDPKLKFKTVLKNNNTHEYIIIHHALASKCTVDDIHRWHLERGFIGIGYHFFISKNGFIYKGRDINWQGGHCKEQLMNIKSVGICLEGCYEDYKDQTDKVVPETQFQALAELVKPLLTTYKIPVERVKRHHDFANYKLCPGNYFPWDRFIETLKGVGSMEDIKVIIGKKVVKGKLIGNRTYVPVTEIVDAFNRTVRWEADERAVYIE